MEAKQYIMHISLSKTPNLPYPTLLLPKLHKQRSYNLLYITWEYEQEEKILKHIFKHRKKGAFNQRCWNRLRLHYLRISPENTVLMEIIRRIEPEIVSFFSAYACASIAINVGLNPPVSASDVTQELKINLIMVPLEHITIWHLYPQGKPWLKTLDFFWGWMFSHWKWLPLHESWSGCHRFDPLWKLKNR